ncbi:TetR/AcrR family transcriptional regulator [Psychrobacillus vulpis]|uniref:TetR/AcrR family transcriptional regulator n=1 Tax=Psychrobacillus vulpis TaxID=2325572 RepID=UPI001407379B|nr:TetR/AcrR family transcriptional regulator [Psychrobacillus vulpis]
MVPKVSEGYKQEKKTEIIHAAVTVFGEKGYYSTTMDDLVRASGMSKGAIYHYFKSKEEVYDHMLQQQVSVAIEKLKDKFSKLDSTIEKVNVLFDMYTSDEWLKEPKLNNVRNQLEHWISGSRADDRKKYENHSELFYLLLNTILKEGQDSGEISKEFNTSHAAKIFWSMIDGILLHASVLQPTFPYSDIVKSSKEMYITFLTRGVIK